MISSEFCWGQSGALEIPQSVKEIELRLATPELPEKALVMLKSVQNGKSLIQSYQGAKAYVHEKALGVLGKDLKASLKIQFWLLVRGEERGSWVLPPTIQSSLWNYSRFPVFKKVEQQVLRARLVLQESSAEKVVVLLDLGVRAPDLATPLVKADEGPSKEDLAKARAEKLRQETLAQFKKSWEQLQKTKYLDALSGFENVLKNSIYLSDADKSRARFGRALSLFNLEGCGRAASDFAQVLDAPELSSDVSYYQGICFVENSENEKAKKNFSRLLESNHPTYSEASRFYMGLSSENLNEFDEAENFYKDTIDFAQNPQLVQMAQDRLKTLGEKKALHRYRSKLFNVLGTVSLGWDSNAVALPSSLQPSDLNLKSEKSANYLGLALVEMKNPWSFKAFENKFQYSYFTLGYFDEAIAESTNIQSHEMGTQFSWTQGELDNHTATLSYALTYLGPYEQSEKFLSSPALKWDWTKAELADGGALRRLWQSSFKVSYQIPAQEALTPDLDSTALATQASTKLRLPRGEWSLGPGANIDLKFAKGKENTQATLGLLGFAETTLSPDKHKLQLSQELGISEALYYRSSSSRKDFLISYSSSLARMWSGFIETRAQLSYSKNISSEADQNSYNRIQASLMLSAFY